MRKTTLRTTTRGLAVALLSLGLMQCAVFSGSARSGQNVAVSTSDRLFLAVAPLDPAVIAELERIGLDPVRFAEDFEGELRYQLYLRGQEEARDSLSATVRVDVSVLRLMPGTGNTGTYGIFALAAVRDSDPERLQWEWNVRARDNVPEIYLGRYLPRAAAAEVLQYMQPARSRTQHAPDLDHPPPLILIR